MQAGIQQEPEIIKDYLTQQAQNGNNITVDKCGFFVSKTHPFLGASPDGIVSRHPLRDLLHISHDTWLAVFRTMCVCHVNLSSD